VPEDERNTVKRPLLISAIVLAALVAATPLSRAGAKVPQTIKLSVAFHDVQVDLGKKGPSLGDERVFADSMLDAKGNQVGRDAGVCTFTRLAPPEAACHITFFLSDGQIAIQFLNAPPPRKLAAIVGGTGAYRSARGEAVILEGARQTGSVTFSLAR
jgi:hypothetical protein